MNSAESLGPACDHELSKNKAESVKGEAKEVKAYCTTAVLINLIYLKLFLFQQQNRPSFREKVIRVIRSLTCSDGAKAKIAYPKLTCYQVSF